MQYPAGVLTLARNFGPKVFGAAGVGRFALNGQFDTSGPNNAQLAENLVFAGLELRPNGTTGYGLQWRLYSVNGIADDTGWSVACFPRSPNPVLPALQDLISPRSPARPAGTLSSSETRHESRVSRVGSWA